jgi:4-deoxy-L-threo-5-hexosulose-uronate ketol-isomerase
LYFDLAGEIVVHLMGAPEDTRHLIVRDGEAVLSPPWSIHMGVGTGPYRFLWIMAGDNQDFTDVDPVTLASLR